MLNPEHTAMSNGVNGVDGVNGHTASAICGVEEFLKHEYDYVIVGGGTAGLAIAARLTENPDVKVGVLEAGKNRIEEGDMFVDTPAMFLQMLGNPEYDWIYHTTPQKANKDRIHHLARGKALGGSSAINYMMYVRGSEQDYDDWAELAHDKSWSAAEMKQYMRKHQTLEPIDPRVTDRSTMPFVGENHGTSGPVRTSFNDWRLPIEDDVIKAADEVTGFAKKPMDPWSGDHIGFYNTLGTVVRSGPNRGKRSYAARGYLQPNLGRPNLRVLCETMASRIVLENAVAKGVVFRHNGAEHTVTCRREVVVSCGVVESPKLLELSGIGDPTVLRAAGVESKVDLPGVGNNFQDHSCAIVGYKLAPGHYSLDSIYDPNVMADAQKQLMEGQNGPLTCVSSVQGFFPYKLFASEEELKATIQSIKDTETTTPFQKQQFEQIAAHLQSDKSANLQFVLIGATPGWEHGVEDQSKLFPPVDPSKGMGLTLAICLQYPVGRGSIHLKSTDPAEHPVIDPGYLSHPADVAVLAAGVKMLDKMAHSKHLKDKFAERIYPAPELNLQDTKDAKQSVIDWCLGEYHPIGTCAMGDVVDSRLRVKGVHGLRVADASIFPNHVSGNIVSSVYAVAEKAADLIKEDHDHAALKTAK